MIYLSATRLSLFKQCERCFWLEVKVRLKRPRGLFPSLPGGIDRVVKTYFDYHRSQGTLPPGLAERVQGKLFDDQPQLDRWRDWKNSDLRYTDSQRGLIVTAVVDEVLVEDGGLMAPVDYKSHGTPWNRDPSEYYRDQLNLYSLLLYRNGFKVSPRGWICCYYPQEIAVSNGHQFSMPCQVFEIPVSPKAAQEQINAAAACLAGDLPAASINCEYCGWQAQHEVQLRMAQQRSANNPALAKASRT